MRKITLLFVVLALALSASAQSSQNCVIVRGGVNHRVRNAAIFGVLTGGIGLVGGLALSNTTYERIDSMGSVPFKTKYSGSELKKMAEAGTHVVVVAKNEATPVTSVACGTAPVAPVVNEATKAPAPVAPVTTEVKPPVVTPVAAAATVTTPATPATSFNPDDPNAPVCLSTIVEANGDMRCLHWAQRR